MSNASAVNEAIKQLLEKVGDDEEIAVIIAVLTTAWAETLACLADAERDLGTVGARTAEALQRLGSKMDQLRTDAAAGDAELAALHTSINNKLINAGQSAEEAKTTMRDTLQIFAEYDGNVETLKRGVAGLASGVLNTVAPGVGGLLGPKISKVLGVS